jgi:hypothetical protein
LFSQPFRSSSAIQSGKFQSIRDLDFQTLDSFNTPQNLIEFDIFRLFASEKLLEAQQRFCDLILRNSKLKLLPKLSDGIFFTMSDSLP